MTTAEGPGRRPENIEQILLTPENTYLLSEKVQIEQSEGRNRFNIYSDQTFALSKVCMNIGSATIKALDNEYHGLILHPGYEGIYSDLNEDDKKLVGLSYAAIAMGAAIIALREPLDNNTGEFDRNYFCTLYNNATDGTSTRKITIPRDVRIRGINNEKPEPMPEKELNIIRDSYEKFNTIDFGDTDIWLALPQSLRFFLTEKKLSGLIRYNLSPAFKKHLELLSQREKTLLPTQEEFIENQEPTQQEVADFLKFLDGVEGLD